MSSQYIRFPALGLTSAVTSLNSLTGAVTLAAGSNVTLTPVGNTITISASGGGGGSGMAIGAAVTSGTAQSVLFIDSGTNLAQDNSNFAYFPASTLLIAKYIGSADAGLNPQQVDLVSGVLSTTSGNQSVDWNNYKLVVGATNKLQWDGSGITVPSLTASRAVVTDASKVLTSSAVTSTELGYLSGVTSAIQTQLNSKGSGTVTSVSGTSPIASSGGNTPAISIADAAADGTTKGAAAFTAADFNSSSGVISLDYVNGQKASGSVAGFLSSADWTTFNGKESALTFSTGLTRSVNTITVNTSQNISTLSNLTSNGFVKTSGGTGALSIDTSTYLTGNQTITLSGDVSGSGTTAITTTIGAAKVTNAMLAGSIDLTTKVTGVLPLANGGTNKNMTAVAGGIVWTDSDSMEVSSAGTAGNWVLSGGTGTPTMSNTTTTGKFVDGSADEIQMRVQGHSTQTSNIVTVEKSDATILLNVTNTAGTAIRGTTTNDSASAGFVGELISANSAGGITPAASGSFKTVASISLTAGDWDVEGVCGYTGGGTTAATRLLAQISTTNDGSDSTNNGGVAILAATLPVSALQYLSLSRRRISLSATTTVYITAALTYTTLGGATYNSDSYISARRVR